MKERFYLLITSSLFFLTYFISIVIIGSIISSAIMGEIYVMYEWHKSVRIFFVLTGVAMSIALTLYTIFDD